MAEAEGEAITLIKYSWDIAFDDLVITPFAGLYIIRSKLPSEWRV